MPELPATRPGPGPGAPRVGAHVPVAGGFAAGLRYAADIGAEAIQVFVSNPRSWALPATGLAEQARVADTIRTGWPRRPCPCSCIRRT